MEARLAEKMDRVLGKLESLDQRLVRLERLADIAERMDSHTWILDRLGNMMKSTSNMISTPFSYGSIEDEPAVEQNQN